MTNSNNNGGSDYKTFHRRAKAWDGILAKEATFFDKSNSNFGRSKVKFDGKSERSGVSEKEIKDRIASCREAYENVGIIGNIIDLMTDFGIEGIEIYHESKSIEKFFKQWANKVKLREVSEQILKSIYRDGNVPILSFTGKIQNSEIEKFKRSFGSKSINTLFDDNSNVSSKIIPYKFKVLDAMNLHRTGNSILGNQSWAYQYDTNECKGLLKNKDDASVKKIKDSMTDKEWNALTKDGLVELNPEKFTMLFYKKDGYRCWANPMLWRVMEDIKFKKMIRDMDISVAEGVTNALTIVKLGDTANGFTPTKNKYNKMVSMLKNPSKSKTIVWDDLIDVKTEYPPVKDFFSAEKYKQVDDDIRSGLGIAEVLVNGGGGNYSDSFLSVKTLLERLETGRQILLDFLREQIEIVTRNMGFRKGPHIRLTNMSLTDEQSQKKFMLDLFDRNALSYETLVSRFGENLNIELSRMKEEEQIRRDNVEESPFALLRVGKFGPQYPNGPPSLLELTDPDQINLPSAQEDKGKDGGSPTGPKNRKKVEEEPPKPVGELAADLSFNEKDVSEAFDISYNAAKDFICKDRDYEDARSLKNEDLDHINNLIVNSITEALVSNYGELKLSKDEFDKKLSKSKSSMLKSIDDYISKNNRRPSKSSLKNIIKEIFVE